MTLFSNFGKFGVLSAGGAKGSVGTGGTIVALNGYNYHVFTSSGTFQVTELGKGSDEAGALVIAGGGAGGVGLGGGGGAGGVLYSSASFPLAIASYSVTIGAGSAGGNSPLYPQHSQRKGSNSQLGPHVALGGGAGGAYSYLWGPAYHAGSPGGSGGGAGGVSGTSLSSTSPGTQPSNNPTPSIWTTYGHDGGRGSNGPYQAGGGGGSGGQGNTAYGTSTSQGAGHGGVAQPFAGWPGPGLGLPAIPSVFWAAGGGGGGYPGPGSSPTGNHQPNTEKRNGIGGAAGSASPHTNAITNSGSGGGGALHYPVSGAPHAGAGGSGIVIIRYLN